MSSEAEYNQAEAVAAKSRTLSWRRQLSEEKKKEPK
jgi:hypothetical protein